MFRGVRVCSILVLAAVLGACGGGGGGSAAPPGTGGGEQHVSATGVLVDHESGVPLSGESVGLAPWTAGAPAVPQGVTASDGTFTVSAGAPGEYLLVIGSDSPSDTTRPTIHDAIELTSSAQTLIAPTMPPVPDETPNPVEQSGHFRLTTLTPAEAACLSYENEVRSSHSYAPVVSDEWLTENNRMNWQRTVDTGDIGGVVELTAYNSFLGLECTCITSVVDDFLLSTPLSFAALTWYAGDSGGSQNESAYELGMFDPRAAVLPIPTPSSPWP